jgi:hypothetical protein
MRTTLAAAAFLLVTGAVQARAQEAPPPAAPAAEDQDRDNDREAPRRHIQVLQHPYDLSSFYRSSSGGSTVLGYDEGTSDEKYPIAGFYRAGGGNGRYSRFWTNGYGNGSGNGYRSGQSRGGFAIDRGSRGRGLIGAPRSRAMGLNGDLVLFAPTFLASAGPLTGVFFER